jgi:hypothetical protein
VPPRNFSTGSECHATVSCRSVTALPPPLRAPAPDFATSPVANWTKFNFCSGTCRSKPRSVTSDASRNFGVPSTIGSELNWSLGRKASDGRVQRPPPVIDPNIQAGAAGGRMMVNDGQG